MKCKFCDGEMISTGKVLLESNQAEMKCNKCDKSVLVKIVGEDEEILLEG